MDQHKKAAHDARLHNARTAKRRAVCKLGSWADPKCPLATLQRELGYVYSSSQPTTHSMHKH